MCEDERKDYKPDVEDNRLFADRRTDAVSDEYERAMSHNNPQHEAVGDHTGRCRYCGSKDLWDDNLAYGCNNCGAFLGGN